MCFIIDTKSLSDLTPRPPSLKGKGEILGKLPSPFRGGAGEGFV